MKDSTVETVGAVAAIGAILGAFVLLFKNPEAIGAMSDAHDDVVQRRHNNSRQLVLARRRVEDAEADLEAYRAKWGVSLDGIVKRQAQVWRAKEDLVLLQRYR